jgi:hypothetical protein
VPGLNANLNSNCPDRFIMVPWSIQASARISHRRCYALVLTAFSVSLNNVRSIKTNSWC